MHFCRVSFNNNFTIISCTYQGRELKINEEIEDGPCKKCKCLETGQTECKDVVSQLSLFLISTSSNSIFSLLSLTSTFMICISPNTIVNTNVNVFIKQKQKISQTHPKTFSHTKKHKHEYKRD